MFHTHTHAHTKYFCISSYKESTDYMICSHAVSVLSIWSEVVRSSRWCPVWRFSSDRGTGFCLWFASWIHLPQRVWKNRRFCCCCLKKQNCVQLKSNSHDIFCLFCCSFTTPPVTSWRAAETAAIAWPRAGTVPSPSVNVSDRLSCFWHSFKFPFVWNSITGLNEKNLVGNIWVKLCLMLIESECLLVCRW